MTDSGWLMFVFASAWIESRSPPALQWQNLAGRVDILLASSLPEQHRKSICIVRSVSCTCRTFVVRALCK